MRAVSAKHSARNLSGSGSGCAAQLTVDTYLAPRYGVSVSVM